MVILYRLYISGNNVGTEKEPVVYHCRDYNMVREKLLVVHQIRDYI